MNEHEGAASAKESTPAEGEAVPKEPAADPAAERTKAGARPWWEGLAAVTKAIIGTFGL